MAGTIEEYLYQIEHAIFGKDVRQAIHDGIEKCYEDASSGVDYTARSELADMKGELNAVANPLNGTFAWEMGGAYVGTNDYITLTDLDIRCRFLPKIKSDVIGTISAKDGYEVVAYACTYDGTLYHVEYNIGGEGWKTVINNVDNYRNYYIVVVARKADDTSITVSEATRNVIYTTKSQEAVVKAVNVGYYPGVTPDVPYDDVNTFPINTVVLAYRNRNVTNLPNRTGAVFTVATLCGVTTGLVTAFQLASEVMTNRLYLRTCTNTGVWSEWREIGAAGSGERIVTVYPSDNLVDAIADAYASGNTTIIVNGGTHNMLEEYGITNDRVSYPDNFDFYGPKIGNNCKIIGINGAKLNAIYSGTVDELKEKFAILNIISSCEIIGLNMEVTNARYCVHDDPNNLYHDNRAGYRVVYEDCVMVHNGSNGSYSAPACIGAGTTQRSEHVINRCVFTSPTSYFNAVTYHNNSGNLTAKLTITNSVFKNDCGIRLFAMEEQGSYVNAVICGNYYGDDVRFVPANTNRFNATIFNNTKY